MIGRILANRYEILEQLGGGGMAIVYKGRDTMLGRLVTIKVLRPEYTTDAEFVARFRREAQAVASLSHPNIVSIYDVGQEENIQFLVMEYVDGENLKTLIKRLGLLPAAQAVDIAVQIGEALEHAHENNIVHRDVKPHNILITRLGRAKLTDFGLAMEASTGTVVKSGTVMGSVHYLSPEQARGEVAGPKSDIYSLGVVLYEMLAGAVPFRAETPVGVAMKHIQENPPPVAAVNAAVPSGLAAVVARSMQKDPALRYASVRDMVADLTDSWRERAAPIEETLIIRENIRPAEGDKVGKKRRARPVAWAIMLVLAAAVVFGAAHFLAQYLTVPDVAVPNVVGKTYAEASTAMQGAGLGTEKVSGYNQSVAKGLVISQDPVAGALVKKGRTIILTVSEGVAMVQVPDLSGMTSDDASAALSSVGLLMQSQLQSSSTVPDSQVISQSPKAGSSIRKGGSVTVVVSTGPEASVAVPDLTGMSLTQAGQELASFGLAVNQSNVAYAASTQYLAGQVVSQSPPAGTTAATGTVVQVTLSTGPGPVPRDATVSVTIPTDGKNHLLRIMVRDVRGSTNVYEQTEPPGTAVTQTVRYYGKATIYVYLDGNLVEQQQEGD